MIAPTMTGALFNSERRQTPFVELDGLVMRALLALPRNEASLAGKNLCFPGKFPAPSGPSEVEMSCLERRGECRLEAAVKSFLLTRGATEMEPPTLHAPDIGGTLTVAGYLTADTARTTESVSAPLTKRNRPPTMWWRPIS